MLKFVVVTLIKKDYRFDEVLNIFDEIDNNPHGLRKYQTFKMINKKNEMVHYLKDMEWKLIKMLSTPIVVRKINNEKFQLKRLWKKKRTNG